MCIANWISYAYIQIHSFPDSFSIYVIVEYWVEFSILYSVFPGGLVSKQSASNAGDVDSIPELGISSGEGNGNPHQYSCLENWSLLLSILYIVVCVCVCMFVCVKSLQMCLTLCDPMDCSPLGSSVHGILQARILEWIAMPSSRRTSWPRDWTHISYVSCIGRWVLYQKHHLGRCIK